MNFWYSISDGWRSGLEADQKVIAAYGCYAMTATTALTAQNTQGVYGIHHTPPEFVKKQIDACVDDIGVDVVKMGTPVYINIETLSMTLLLLSVTVLIDPKACWPRRRP